MIRETGKSQTIYRELRARIVSGRLEPGRQLPKESDFCREFGVARETLRRALERLEAENLIDRRRSLGTFVAERRERPPVINFLLPCSDFLSRCGVVPVFNRQLFEGVMTECYRRNCRVSTIAVSADNDNRHIDLRQLRHLEPESRVVIQSAWFEPVFPYLESLNCRMVFVGGYIVETPLLNGRPRPRPPATAKKVIFNDRYAFELAATELYKAGCRKVALAAPAYVDDLYSPPRNGYLEAADRFGQKQPLIFPLPDAAPRWPWLPGILSRRHAETGFDGLVLCPRDGDEPDSGVYFNYTLGLPDSVKVVISWLMPERSFQESCLPSVVFDTPAIGRIAAKALLDERFVADEIVISPHFRKPPPGDVPAAWSREDMPSLNPNN